MNDLLANVGEMNEVGNLLHFQTTLLQEKGDNCRASTRRFDGNSGQSLSPEKHSKRSYGLGKKIWYQLGDIKQSSKLKNPDYSEEDVLLPFTNELLDKPTSRDTKALKMERYEGHTDNCLYGFIYAVKG
ncbi:hypothetical protein DVH24_005930 [Malus domestica]|uniref:Uncharacterized protein n=1 Tax=Malus domestica TaxID=3750 RepID=A0A498INR3_MALDO|nr:hypothetical protein DVH24_005930 [Malus domestica]